MNLSKLFREFFAPATHRHEWSAWEAKPPGSMRLGPLLGVRLTNAEPALYRACKTCSEAEMRPGVSERIGR